MRRFGAFHGGACSQWVAAGLLALSGLCAAQSPPPPPWPDTPQSREFRRRVMDLALLYGESSGLDGNGYRIETTDLGLTSAGCHRVRVRIRLADVLVSESTLEHCKPG